MNNLFEIILRVPPLIILDHILATNFGTKTQSHYEFLKSQIDNFLYNKSLTHPKPGQNSTIIDDLELNEQNATYLTVNLNLLAFLLSIVLFLLSSKHIKRFYLCLISISLIFASNYSSSLFIDFLNTHIKKIQEVTSGVDYELLKAGLISYTAQLILVELLYLVTPSSSTGSNTTFITKHVSRYLFALPTILGVVLELPLNILNSISVTVTIIVSFDLLTDWVHFIKDVYKVITEDYAWCKNIIKYHGLLHLIELQWQRLMVPQVLKSFWLTKFIYQLVIIAIILLPNLDYFNWAADNQSISGKDLLLFTVKQLSIAGCETIICVSGMSSVLCSILNKIGQLIQKFLIAIDDGEDRNLGKISAVLFFVLALQTGLTEISAELRFIRLYRNLCLLLTANLYIIHSMVNPLLFTLSASKNRSLNRHARPLIVCLLLMIFPSWFLVFLWKHNQMSTWLLAVSTFCVEIVIKVNLTLLIYGLYMVDAYRATIWEKLDDYVFFIKSLQSAIQFVFSVFIFCNGAWILVYESGGAIRAMMISIHAYFNIWTQAKEGWKIFSKRRKAVSKLDMLRDATPEQLSQLNDVCAICYQELTNAKITLCNHYFHSICLRKWLNMNDSCPLCLSIMFKTTKSDKDTTEELNNLNNNVNQSSSSSSSSSTSLSNSASNNSLEFLSPEDIIGYDEE